MDDTLCRLWLLTESIDYTARKPDPSQAREYGVCGVGWMACIVAATIKLFQTMMKEKEVFFSVFFFLIYNLNFGRSKTTVQNCNFGQSKITVHNRNFWWSRFTVHNHNFGRSKIKFHKHNFKPSKITDHCNFGLPNWTLLHIHGKILPIWTIHIHNFGSVQMDDSTL